MMKNLNGKMRSCVKRMLPFSNFYIFCMWKLFVVNSCFFFLNLRQLNQKNLSLSQIQLAYEQQISTLGAQIIDLRE